MRNIVDEIEHQLFEVGLVEHKGSINKVEKIAALSSVVVGDTETKVRDRSPEVRPSPR